MHPNECSPEIDAIYCDMIDGFAPNKDDINAVMRQSTESPSSVELLRSFSSPSLETSEIVSETKLTNIRAPGAKIYWRRGLPAIILWNPWDLSVKEIRIVLLRKRKCPREYTIVAEHVENNGLFVLTQVPRDLAKENDYFLRFMSMDGKQFVDSARLFVGE
jgi:hypothetical protein